LKIVKEEEKKTEKKNLGVKEWTEEDENKIGNMVDPYYEF